MTATDPRAAVEAVWRIESARLIAGLARLVRDVGLAEDLAQDALVAALEQWPRDGVPDAPGPWLMTVAKRRAIDTLRRRDTYAGQAGAPHPGRRDAGHDRAGPRRSHRRRPAAADLHRGAPGARHRGAVPR